MEPMLVSPILKNTIIFVTRRTFIYTTALQYNMEEIKKLDIDSFHVLEGMKVNQIYWSNYPFG